MQEFQRRAAISAFVWTMVTMIVAGILVFWSADVIPVSTTTQTTAAYSKALDLANQRLTEASQRIAALEQRQTTVEQASTDVQPTQVDSHSDPRITLDADTATRIAAEVAGTDRTIATAYLVDLEGNIAWAVPYESAIIYVHAHDGEIIFIERTH